MSVDDKIFWLMITMPIIPCVVSFILGGTFGVLIMAFMQGVGEYQDPSQWDNLGGDECNPTNTEQ